jgi:hypothetical protein
MMALTETKRIKEKIMEPALMSPVSFRGSCISRQRIVRRYEKANSESRKSDEAGPGRSFTAAGRISAPLGWLMKELFGLFYDIGAVSFYLYII